MPSEPSTDSRILDHLKNLEARLSRIEAHLELEAWKEPDDVGTEAQAPAATLATEEALEFRIGQTWFAKVGIVALAVGIAFLLGFPHQGLPPALPSLFGYLLVGAIVALSRVWRTSFSLISRYLMGGALLLFYFATLRLHFFGAQPALADTVLLVPLLLVVVAVNLIVSVRRNSIYLAGLSLTMGYITPLVGGEPPLLFAVVVIMSFLVVFFKLRYHWNALIVLGIVLSYLTHFVWALNNPFLGNDLHIVSSPQANLLFILLYALILAAGDLFRGKDVPEDFRILISSTLNGIGSYSLFLLLTLTSFKTGFGLYHLLASALFLAVSVVFWVRERSKYATFVYAMLGYMALSVAIIDQFRVPDVFIWLSWQTMLVISTGVWFRSRFIIVANFVIYLIVFVAYLFFAGKVGVVSLGFGVIALSSARILNWQKNRLQLRTEVMRNAYLAGAFFIFPYALYHAMPSGYVSLSWVGVALFYYISSMILKNTKYRWMALLTLILTVAYVFIFDIAKLEPTYRIASFLVLGVVLVFISIAYSKRRMRGGGSGEQDT